MIRSGADVVRLAALTAVVVTLSGCAGMFAGAQFAPNGLSVGEDRLRHMLATGNARTAFERLGHAAPDDEMLRALYHGVVAYHAGDYAESARVLDIAAAIADERMTKSISRAALSLVSSDNILLYEPGATERLMIPYYAALARLRLGDTGGAAVEARRLSLLLQQFDDRNTRVEPALRATLRYIAGAVFEAQGELNDADVAYRNAVAIDSTLRMPADPRRTAGDSATVLVILEQGFVAHRVEQALAVMLLPEEVEAIAHGDLDEKAAIAAFVAGRVLERVAWGDPYGAAPRHGTTFFVGTPDHTIAPKTRRRQVCTTRVTAAEAGDSTKPGAARPVAAREAREVRECVEREEEIDGLPYLLKVAWPVYRADYRPAPARLVAGGDAAAGSAFGSAFGSAADLSRGVVADFEGDRLMLIARTVARGTAKLALTKSAERKVEEKNEVAGALVGLLGNIGSVLLERADTRSWHLLPAGISLARVRLPPGEHALGIEVAGRTVAVDPFVVGAGELAIISVRTY
jgi:hypothetical protein